MSAMPGQCWRSRALVPARLLAVAGVVLSLVAPRFARGSDLTAAANAYSRAQQAELAGRPATAAQLYELADSLAPTPEALRSALRARRAAGQLSTAALHAETLLERYPEDERSTELARETLAEAEKSLARYEITCAPGPCGLIVDGAATGPTSRESHVLFLEPGEHEVRADFASGTTEPLTLTARAGDPDSLSFEAPPELAPDKADDAETEGTRSSASTDPVGMDSGPSTGGGLSPWYFAGAAVVTAGLGAATIWSGLDVLSAHDDYQNNQTQSAYEDGKDRELRTNILIGATAGVGALTVVLAIFTDFGGSEQSSKAEPPATSVTATIDPALNGSTMVTIRGIY